MLLHSIFGWGMHPHMANVMLVANAPSKATKSKSSNNSFWMPMSTESSVRRLHMSQEPVRLPLQQPQLRRSLQRLLHVRLQVAVVQALYHLAMFLQWRFRLPRPRRPISPPISTSSVRTVPVATHPRSPRGQLLLGTLRHRIRSWRTLGNSMRLLRRVPPRRRRRRWHRLVRRLHRISPHRWPFLPR